MTLNGKEQEKLLDLFKLILKLKKLKRKGWIQREIGEKIESVADHSFSLSILSMIIADEMNLDKDKLIKMSLIHDLPESVVGDITPYDKTAEEKHEVELEAMKKISLMTKNSDEYFNLWVEFEQGKSKEAVFLKQLDKLEMVLQALDYELSGCDPKKLDEFWGYTKNQLSDPYLIQLFKTLKKMRKK